MSPPHPSTRTSGKEMLSHPGPTSRKYQTDWRDTLRHFSNLAFVGSYLFFERGVVLPGACCTVVGELLLAPSAIKHRSWSTVVVGGVFLALAIGTISRSLL